MVIPSVINQRAVGLLELYFKNDSKRFPKTFKKVQSWQDEMLKKGKKNQKPLIVRYLARNEMRLAAKEYQERYGEEDEVRYSKADIHQASDNIVDYILSELSLGNRWG